MTEIRIVADQACPGCGAYWGHPDPALDYPNRPKVDDDWKCYNPACEVGFYRDGRIVEMKPTPEEQAELDAQMAQYSAWLRQGTWVQEGNAHRFVPAPGTTNPLARR